MLNDIDPLDAVQQDPDMNQYFDVDPSYQYFLTKGYLDIAAFYRHFKKIFVNRIDQESFNAASSVITVLDAIVKTNPSRQSAYEFYNVIKNQHEQYYIEPQQIEIIKEDEVGEKKKKRGKKQEKMQKKSEDEQKAKDYVTKIFSNNLLTNEFTYELEQSIFKASLKTPLQFKKIKTDYVSMGGYILDKDRVKYADNANRARSTEYQTLALKSLGDNNVINAPSMKILEQMTLNNQFRDEAQDLVDQIKLLDSNSLHYMQRDNSSLADAGISQLYTKQIAEILQKSKWVRTYLFQGNEDLSVITDFASEPLIVGVQEFIPEADRALNFIRFTVIGSPILNTQINRNRDGIAIDTENTRIQAQFLDYFNLVNNVSVGQQAQFFQPNEILAYYQYFVDGYITSSEVRQFSDMMSRRMRQFYLFENNKKEQGVARGKRPMVGVIEQVDSYVFQQQNGQELAQSYISRYLPTKDIITVSDLMRVNGVKTAVYYRMIQLFYYIYTKLRNSAPFTTHFDFLVKQKRLPEEPLKEIIETVVNPNPFPLISKILTVVKDMLSVDVDQNQEWLESFEKELVFSKYRSVQEIVSCQSIGRLYSYTVKGVVSSEPIVMIASLLIKVLDTPEKVLLQHIFKCGWSFLSGRHEYTPFFKSVVTILPYEVTFFLKRFYSDTRKLNYFPDMDRVQRIYQYALDDSQARIKFEQNKRLRGGKGYPASTRGLDTKEFLYKFGEFNPKARYFEKAYYVVSQFNVNSDDFSAKMAAYFIAALILDTIVVNIQDSLNDKIKNIKIITGGKRSEDYNPDLDDTFKSASLSYFSVIVQRSEDFGPEDEPFIPFGSMECMSTEIWQKYCDVSYQPYDLVAYKYKINCLLMLIWYSRERRYFYSAVNEMDIYLKFSSWVQLAENIQLIQKANKISASNKHSTELNVILKQYLDQYNVYVIQMSEVQYIQNTNQEPYKLYKCTNIKLDKKYFIVGIYYNHIFMAKNVDPVSLPKKKYMSTFNLRFLTPKIRAVHFPPIMYIFAFDFETTQIKMKLKSANNHTHDMKPYMLSWSFFSLQRSSTQDGLRLWGKPTTQTIDDGEDFIEQVYNVWLNKIIQLDSDVYFLSYNGSKFDLQFLYKCFVKHHSGAIQFYGTLLSPKYICITYNRKNIYFVDLMLILGGGKLNDWAILHGLPQKLKFYPMYSIEQWKQSKKKLQIAQYCEQDVRLVAQIYQKQCEQMIQTMQKLRINFNDDAINVLTPTQASLAFRLFKNTLKYDLQYIAPEDDTELHVRNAYKGGFCHSYRLGRIQGDLHYFDINSLYPSIMMGVFPTSPPTYVDYNVREFKDVRYLLENFKDAHWRIGSYEYKTKEKFCFIPQKIGHMGYYFRKGYELETTYVPSSILELILPQLKNIHIVGALVYGKRKGHTNAPIFAQYISEMYSLRLEAKAQNDKLNDKRIKALMNALYGKLAQQQKLRVDLIASKYNGLFDSYGACDFDYTEFLDAFIMYNPTYKNNSLSYLAMEIAARSRAFLFKTILANQDSVLYCDTDSLILNGQPKQMEIDGKSLGCWKDMYPYPSRIHEIYIYCPKVYEIIYLNQVKDPITGQKTLEQCSEIKIKGINKGYQNFSKNFKYLQNNLSANFGEQIVWQRKIGYVRQNASSKKIQYRVRRFVFGDGSTRPFDDYEEYLKYFKLVLTMENEVFVFKDKTLDDTDLIAEKEESDQIEEETPPESEESE